MALHCRRMRRGASAPEEDVVVVGDTGMGRVQVPNRSIPQSSRPPTRRRSSPSRRSDAATTYSYAVPTYVLDAVSRPVRAA